MNFDQAKRLTGGSQWFRYWMPYQFIRLEGKYTFTYLPLNRAYKPLGLTAADWVDYKDYADRAVVFASDPRKFKGVWTDPLDLYLYEADPESRRDYFSRLERLFSYSAALASRVGLNRRVIGKVAPYQTQSRHAVETGQYPAPNERAGTQSSLFEKEAANCAGLSPHLAPF